MHALPTAVAIPGGQLGNPWQGVGTEPQRLGGLPAAGERGAQHRLHAIVPQVAQPFPIPASRADVQVEVGAAYQLKHLAVMTHPGRPVADQRPGRPGCFRTGLQVCPGVAMERALLADPIGQRPQIRQSWAQALVAAAPRTTSATGMAG